MTFRNFTPHDFNLYADDGKTLLLSLPSEGQIRVSEEVVDKGLIGGFPFVAKKYGKVTFTGYNPGDILIVSKVVLDACPNNLDLVCPDTGPDSVVRDKNGKILGVRRFQRNAVE